MSASVMQVFHQEMATYYLRPSFEYQELPSRLSWEWLIRDESHAILSCFKQWRRTSGRRDVNRLRIRSRDENFILSRSRGEICLCCSFLMEGVISDDVFMCLLYIQTTNCWAIQIYFLLLFWIWRNYQRISNTTRLINPRICQYLYRQYVKSQPKLNWLKLTLIFSFVDLRPICVGNQMRKFFPRSSFTWDRLHGWGKKNI